MPTIGGKKLWKMLNRMHIPIGRDKLYNWLSSNDLLLRYKSQKAPKTTDSSQWLRQFDNLVKNKEVTGINQVWVSDITYLNVGDEFAFLSLITDVYSRRIVGWKVWPTLGTDGSYIALEHAIEECGKAGFNDLIHHSDRGVQYCSKRYTKLLKANGMAISTTQDGSPYDNAIAERVNGILKEEFIKNRTYDTIEEIEKAIDNYVTIYNCKRPHTSLNYNCPDDIYYGRQKGKMKKIY